MPSVGNCGVSETTLAMCHADSIAATTLAARISLPSRVITAIRISAGGPQLPSVGNCGMQGTTPKHYSSSDSLSGSFCRRANQICREPVFPKTGISREISHKVLAFFLSTLRRSIQSGRRPLHASSTLAVGIRQPASTGSSRKAKSD